MEIGHSRLLEFFTKDKPKMEKHTLKIEDLAPSDIESEVPRHQKLREATQPPREKVHNETIEWIDLRDMIKKPVYMGLQEEVIRTQPIRAPTVRNESASEADKTSSEIDKPQTRIPVSKFKPLAERVITERRDASKANGQKSRKEAPEKPRRTSIPKPKDKTPILKKNPTADDRQAVNIQKEPIKEARDDTHVKTNERRAIRRDRIPVMRKDHYKIVKNDNRILKSENEDANKDSGDDQVSGNNKHNKPYKIVKKGNRILKSENEDANKDSGDDQVSGNNKHNKPYKIVKKDNKIQKSENEDANKDSDDDQVSGNNKHNKPYKIVKKDNKIQKSENEDANKDSDDDQVSGNNKHNKPYKIVKNDNKILKSENEYENKDSGDDQVSGNNKHNQPVKSDTNEQLDDEFDKLYDEIVDTDVASLPDDILETKVKDPEILESKFEEIVHQYVDDTIEQVKIEPVDKARYSRIPLLRRRSSHDVKMPGQLERRLSLKTGNINKSVEVRDEKLDDSKIKEKDDIQQNGVREDSISPSPEYTENENPQEDSIVEINNNDEINEDRYNAAESPPIQDYNTIPTPDSELVKVGIFGISARDIPLEETSQNTLVGTPEVETVKVAVIDIPAEDASKYINEDFETVVTNPGYIPEPQEDTFKFEDDNKVIEDNPNSYKNNDIEIQDKSEEDPINNMNDAKETVKNESIDLEQNQIKISQQNIPILKPDDDLKSFGLLKNTNSIEERTKSRYIKKPQNEKPNNYHVATLAEDVPIEKGKVNSILKRRTSQEYPNRDFNSNNNDDKKVIDVKEDVDNMPKKKSVLSKIAMFERAEPEPTSPKKSIHKYSKPKRTISQEIKHSPKIVQEVLKPKGTAQTDKHTIVTVDIIKPVEVITNNEESVTVVENLKEEAVIYENFDDARLNEIESVELEPEKPIIVDQNETVSTVNSEINDNDNVLEIRYFNQESNKEYVTRKDNKPKFNDYHYERTANEETNKIKFDNRDKPEKWKSTEALADFVPVKEKINRLKSYEDTKLKKAKSTAELDLGDAIKGKVKNMIVRMNSCELLDVVKQKEVISVKERPRKRSVSEKIALFERKLTPVAMEDVKVDTGRALNLDNKPVRDSINSIQANGTVADYTAKVKELVNAKLKYGSANMSYMQLRDGRNMPVLALGTALLDSRLAKHIVAAAIDLGFRAIDTAFIYGNEREVGEGIRAKIQDGTVRREELFIISKLWSTFHRPDLVETACRASLAATGLDYFDLFMIHNPMSLKEGGDPLPKIANVLQFSQHDYLDAWFAMEELVPKGLVRSIGVSNFNSAQLARVLEKGRIKPVVNQVECHPYLSQQRLSEFCDARDVRLSCFGVLGSKGTPAELKASQAAVIDDPLVQVMAAGLGISPAQLLIRYQIDSGHNVVVKASTAAHLWDDLKALNVTLEAPQIAAMHALNKNKRTFTFQGMGDTHRNYPFRIAF